jgi:acyl transferase domain-containing protein/acyl-CoA synthetase (AMP-forming)/AMP-acid ligase II/acyl carrier protein/SAM-dependent methyltransferase
MATNRTRVTEWPVEPTTLVELLERRALEQPNQLAYTFLVDGETQEISLTYGELTQQARAVGAWLQRLGAREERVLLVYPSSLDFIAAFFGCLYAGAVAVPTAAPQPRRLMSRIGAIAADAQARFALTSSHLLSYGEPQFVPGSELQGLCWLETDSVDGSWAKEWQDPGANTDTLALLQYTSGSTAAAKGVMVSHGNVLHNLAYIDHDFEHTTDSVSVTWLPHFHDMGLIYGIIQPLYNGFPCLLMPPIAFVQQPIRWLQAISRYKATHSGGPNFAYDLCVRKITPEQCATLDLSSWCVAFNGAEPVRKETLERFAEAFQPCGFRWNAFYPAYGLAEATLKVSGGLRTDEPVFCPLEATALQRNRVMEPSREQHSVRTPVGCGRTTLDTKIAIVHPESMIPCSPDEVGEIWVSSPSVAQGYWNRPQETEHTFRAHLADGAGPFLRTGDLGFVKKGHLFVTGRLKDMIIIRGQNHYPQDIEATVEKSHSALQPGCGVAFSVELNGEEKLVLFQEVKRGLIRSVNLQEVIKTVVEAVWEHHELDVYSVSLLKPGRLPKTSSGKSRRLECRAVFLAGGPEIVGHWTQGYTGRDPRHLAVQDPFPGQLPTRPEVPQLESIQAWLVTNIAQRLKISPRTVDTQQPFAYFGLDSITAVSLLSELGNWLGRKLSPTLAYDYPTITDLARYLAGESDALKAKPQIGRPQAVEAAAIAIIGLGCRFPSASDPAAFWQLLRNGVDAITEVPADRWDVSRYYDSTPATPGKMNTRWGGFLADVDQFDPDFFGIAPREAIGMDPQHRLLLEVAWEALENAAQSPSLLAGSSSGVFVGISGSDYSRIAFDHLVDIDAYAGVGNALSMASNRLSYLLDWRGPSWAVDTACSSSLVAVHHACQSLRQSECDLALAGGVNLILSPDLTVVFSQARMMAADGRCKTFDARADGYVRGEGCGMVVLKRLSDAVRDGDPIWAVIRGAALNQDGRTNGLTAPSGISQQVVIRQALKNAGVAPADISYVEAHGTGTALGDPIEVHSLQAVLMRGRSLDQPCWMGSVKTNIGHLEAAAGIAGLIKVALSLQHEEIPPHLHLRELNPEIALKDIPLSVPTELKPWRRGNKRRMAGVSSFGFGGTNVHVVLEEAPVRESAKAEMDRPLHVLTLSAKSEDALRELANRYETHLVAYPDSDVGDLCFSANVGRSHFDHRLSVVGSSTLELRERLACWNSDQKGTGVVSGHVQNWRPLKVAFLFTGQDSQYVGMGHDLYKTQPCFRRTLERCDAILRPSLETPLLTVMFPEPGRHSPLDQPAYTQPALFALEYALAELWLSWGIEPAVVIGYGLGEYVAACVAGIFSPEQALRVVAERGRLMQSLCRDGEMVTVFASEAQVAAAIKPYKHVVSIAAINGPENTVISGSRRAIHQVMATLEGEGIQSRNLKISHAFHSPSIEPIQEEFEQIVSELTYNSPRLDIVSSITGELATNEMLTPAYWVSHLRQPVRFAAGVETLHRQGYQVFLEIGSKPTLAAMGRQCMPAGEELWLPSLRPGASDWQFMLESLVALYVHGAPVDWPGFDRHYTRQRIQLPTYSFQRKRYWMNETSFRKAPSPEDTQSQLVHPLLGQRLHLAGSPETRFESQINLDFLMDHQVFQTAILPAAAYLEMALAAGATLFESFQLMLENVVFRQPLFLTEDEGQTVQLVLTPEGYKAARFQIFSRKTVRGKNESSFTLHAFGNVLVGENDPEPIHVGLTPLRTQVTEQTPIEDFYEQWQDRGVSYGPRFRVIQQLWRKEGVSLAEIRLPEPLASEARSYQVHPVLLDNCFQTLGAALPNQNETFLPVGLEALRVYRRPGISLWSQAEIRRGEASDTEALTADLNLLDPDGQLVMVVEGLKAQRTSREALLGPALASIQNWLYQVEWQPLRRQGQHPPETLPTPVQIRDRLSSQVANLVSQPGVEAYVKDLAQLESLSVGYIWRAFQQMGWAYPIKTRLSTDSIVEQLCVVRQHRRMLRCLLEILAEEGYLRQMDEFWEVMEIPAVRNPQEELRFLLTHSPAALELTLLERCGSKLAEVLRGNCDPLQLLFPDGGITTVGQLYEESPGAQVMNTLLQKTVVSVLEDWSSGREVRILEIGAGTGGTTSALLPHLPAQQTEYVFTDVSPLFTTKAQEKFRGYPFVRYRLLDIEQEPQAQGFGFKQFDLVVAANVLHATRDLRQTLRHVQYLLKPGGWLVLWEGTVRRRWLDLIFGLTEGWWKFVDLELRPSYPLLSVSQWQDLLHNIGFRQAAAISPGQAGQGIFSQHAVIAAQAAEVRPETALSEPANWIIFADEEGLGQRLAALLRSRDEECVVVFPGQEFEPRAESEFRIDPTSPADFQRLLGKIVRPDKPSLRGVVHLWSIDAGEADSLTAEDLTEILQKGCGSVLYLIQSLVASAFPEPPGLWLVTRGAQPVGNTPQIPGVAQSPLWGMGKVIALEHPELNCVRVDLDPEANGDAVQALFEEIWSGGQGAGQGARTEDQVAFRQQVRHVAKLAPCGQTRGAVVQEALRFRPDSTYLIAGGLGALGLLVARWMVAHGARYLTLVGRRGVNDIVTDQIRELEQANARVFVAQADVSEIKQVASVLADIERSLPPLRGIIQAAGVLDDGVLIQQSWDRFARVLAPKAMGTWNLHTLTQEMSLDFFVMFSSVGSLLGSPGQANHAAANAFMDALAFYRQAQGRVGLSINWGGWSELGAAAQRQVTERATTKGIGAIAPQQGLQVLERLFVWPCGQVGVLPIHWPTFLQQFPPGGIPPQLSELARQVESTWTDGLSPTQPLELRRRWEGASPQDRPSILMAGLQQKVAQVLGLKDVQLNVQEPLSNLGLDSLMAIELRQQVSTDWDVDLPMEKFLEGSSVASLAAQVGEQLSQLPALQSVSLTLDSSPGERAFSGAQRDQSLAINLEKAKQLLGQVNELPDAEVDTLLRALLREEDEGGKPYHGASI